ncbi:hypothetical protein [Thalassotalea piscium]|uniref:Uncharacterized protein n=2 Tax=Thalassotalea piscium TaxID=1230533 RepID=A0A7X0TT73_9GAMM|nr:hypothetical protein [Thalassotalea piscium]MBB6542790.1 hypothetical protein [Thalassotalea piscium]
MKLAKSLKVSTKGTGSTNESSPLEGIGPNDTEVSAHIISEEDFLEKEHVIVLDEYVNSSYVIDDVTEPPKDYAKDIPLEMLSVNEVKVEDMVEYSQNISLESMTETIDEINYGDMFPTENSVLLDDMIDYNVEINTIKASG